METTMGRVGACARRCARPPPAPPPPRASLLRQVASILKKKESLRSSEEMAILINMKDLVKEVKFRIRRRQEALNRSKEIEDEQVILRSKCKKLANAMEKAKHLVVYTGAGISTAADVPDYRGPNGIWTLLQQGKKIGKHDLTLADPTLTHMALWKLYKQRYLKFIVSQNCDGLHLRSGLPRKAISEVHGNMYIEICKSCKPNIQYWRLFDTTERTMRYYHKTGRICHVCGESLEDSIVHFGERGKAQWPLNWTGALHHAAKADVILCLGSSLKVLRRYPWLWAMDKPIKKRPAVFIVNLQWTPKDDVAALKINGKCDNVMKLVMEYLGLETPKYNRLDDPIFAHTSYLTPKELHTTTQPMLIRVASKNVEVDDPDDDCPLNILKMRMNASPDDRRADLSILKNEQDMVVHDIEQTADECDSCNLKTGGICACKICSRKCNDQVSNECSVDNDEFDENKVEESVDGVFQSSENTAQRLQGDDVDINVNSVTNNNSLMLKTADDSYPNNCKYLNEMDSLSVKFSADDFERVHVEMKTCDNEICTVSILLVNNSKKYMYYNGKQSDDSAKCHIPKCDELNSGYLSNNLDTGQQINDFDSNVKNLSDVDENKPHRTKFSDISNDLDSLSNSDFPPVTDNISNLKVKYPAPNGINEIKCSDNVLGNLNKSKQSLDYSFNYKPNISYEQQSHNNKMHNANTKNQIFTTPTVIPHKDDNINLCNVAIDMSFSSDIIETADREITFQNGFVLKPLNTNLYETIDYNFTADLRNDPGFTDNSLILFKRKCESFAKVIIQNTLLSNRKELQYAYSGLHSIIDPTPFCTDYDFKSDFNSFNFIRFAQKLILKSKSNKPKDVGVINHRKEIEIKRKVFTKRLISHKKKKPSCKFCYDHYRSYYCNFYKPYDSEQRFEKWRNGKLVMCICCESDTSGVSEEDSDICDDDLDSKLSKDAKDDDKTSENNDSNSKTDNGDLKRDVQISRSKEAASDDNEVQAGWFGKGFRKGRRRKR